MIIVTGRFPRKHLHKTPISKKYLENSVNNNYKYDVNLGIHVTFDILLCDDSSSLTNEKDHHYFLNSADVCW